LRNRIKIFKITSTGRQDMWKCPPSPALQQEGNRKEKQAGTIRQQNIETDKMEARIKERNHRDKWQNK
jgi:hypothetical protein